jgi:ubiquinone/menaquinone biosynthesis C-methylase UbiE
MQKLYDKNKNRLVYINKSATSDFWDKHWANGDFSKVIYSTPNSWIVKVTKKYLPVNSKILEGGCGPANHVHALNKHNYNVIGLDYAKNTVKNIKKEAPELDIVLGDVFNLPFKDNSFDGYWSLGVIEHFWDGYDIILDEMRRIIKSNGYLFLTFPQMSSLRKMKAKNNKYNILSIDKTEPSGFYQFALDPVNVINDVQKRGFNLVSKTSRDGFKGIKDEITSLNSSLSLISNSKLKINSLAKKIVSKFGDKLNYGHICLLVFKRR